jgi:hypothetical protein
MILDQNVGSARAEKPESPTPRVVRHLFTALLALALAMPSVAAWGMNSAPKAAAAKSNDRLPLPPIPYLESTPWMQWNATAPMLRIDTLMAPSITPWGILQDPPDRAKASPAFS